MSENFDDFALFIITKILFLFYFFQFPITGISKVSNVAKKVGTVEM